MKTYTARAVRWEHGWELHVDGVGVTQVRTLDKAPQQVLDLVETMLDVDVSHAAVTIVPELGGVEKHVHSAKAKAATAARLQVEAAGETRTSALELRRLGLSVTDISVIMGVTRARVSQLLSEAKGSGVVAKPGRLKKSGARSAAAKAAPATRTAGARSGIAASARKP